MSSHVAGMTPTKPLSLSGIMDFINSTEMLESNTRIPVQINFLRNFTLEGIEPFLKYHCLTSGIQPDIVFGNYDTIQQEILDTKSHLYTKSPDILVVALYLETYLQNTFVSDWSAGEVMNSLNTLYSDLAQRTSSTIAINTFVPPFYNDYGIINNVNLSDKYNEVVLLNQLLKEFVRCNSSRFILMDWERFVRLLGQEASMDYRFWYMSKAPFKNGFFDLYSLELVKIARSLKGKSKKCLVLDCDNTLWGGIIGEESLHGIKLDRHSYPGNIFYDFHKKVLKLHERGVLIALCSKNNEQDVFEVFDKHPHTLLKREHFAAYRINWQDKASNIKELSSELNLGLDSFVFIDDNQMECGLIRDLVPEVTVLQVPDKLYTYPRLLDHDGLFDTISLSTEDRKRSTMYRAEVNRKMEQAKYDTIDEYLASLSLSINVHQVKQEEIQRVSQLTQKTNQFNLTTQRYSEAQIKAFTEDPAKAVICLSARDKFGDSGITGVLIAKNDENTGIIDSLLMSCRILGRNIEVAFVIKALEIMERNWNIEVWQATYIPTQKNQQVSEFWSGIGFTEVDRQNNRIIYNLTKNMPRREAIHYITIEEE